jgi:hypothetical protein
MTLKHRRKFTREFKLRDLAEIAAGKSIAYTGLHTNATVYFGVLLLS